MTDPYHMPAGPELDRLIQEWVMNKPGQECPAYSTDEGEADRVLERLETVPRLDVTVGRTSRRSGKWFARYESDPSDGTEVWAESRALAICRLALLQFRKKLAP